MVKSYFQLYQRAKKLYDEGKVSLSSVKELAHKDVFYFKVDEQEITLTISKHGNVWVRHWSCSCESYALTQERTECKHIMAAIYYLLNGGVK